MPVNDTLRPLLMQLLAPLLELRVALFIFVFATNLGRAHPHFFGVGGFLINQIEGGDQGK